MHATKKQHYLFARISAKVTSGLSRNCENTFLYFFHRLNVLKGNVEQAKVKRRYQSEQRKNVMKTMTGNAGNHETATLSVTQLTNVKGLLADQGRSLNELVANVKSVKSDLE